MKLSYLKIIGISIGIVLCLAVLLNSLLTEPINKNNTTHFTAHFESITKVYTRGNTSYDLYIQEKSIPVKIAADYADCFAYDNFQYEVKSGQLIKLAIKQDNSFFNIRVPSVVSIFTNGRDYLDEGCINQKISTGRVIQPLIFIGIIIVLGLVIYEKFLKRKQAM